MMKMKRCLIVTGGTIDIAFAKDFLSQRSYDYVIAADAGLEVLRPLHISPNAVVGDLDTVDKKVLEEYQNQPDIEFEIHKPEKDETDTELALLTAARQGCEAVDILGALGGRMDHAIGNIQLMYQFFCQGMEVNIYDARNRLTREVRDEVQRCFPDHLFGTVIPRNVRLSEAPSHGKSIIHYDIKSKGADAYLNLAKEVALRDPARMPQPR